MTISFKRTKDILAYAGLHKRENQVICGFSMETQHLMENSQKKLISKNCDLIAANSIRESGSGFGTDTNKITIITAEENRSLALMSKDEAAHIILDNALNIYQTKKNH